MTPTPTMTLKTGICPHCRGQVEFEPCEILPRIVPLCDPCAASQNANWQANHDLTVWRKLYRSRMPTAYQSARPDEVSIWFAPALAWKAAAAHGGMGLIGPSGAGKSSAIACRLWTLEAVFLWWSGTEARDAAIEAATADRDREGARRRWEQGMTVPILVLDDVSQGKMTEAWSAKLFDLLETRLGAGLPTLWTSQIPLDEMRDKIARQNGGDNAQADAISRRLAQHSLVLQA